MTRRKRAVNDSGLVNDLPGQGRKKISKEYPKGLVFRMYNAKEEAEINEMRERMGEKTITKAFKKAPIVLREQHKEIQEFKLTIDKQRETIFQLEQIVNSWNEFSKRLDSFAKKKV